MHAVSNPFDLDALDTRTNVSAQSSGAVNPETTWACVSISLLSNLCCVVAITLMACHEEEVTDSPD